MGNSQYILDSRSYRTAFLQDTQHTQNSEHKANEDDIPLSFVQGDDFAYTTYITPNSQDPAKSFSLHPNSAQKQKANIYRRQSDIEYVLGMFSIA